MLVMKADEVNLSFLHQEGTFTAQSSLDDFGICFGSGDIYFMLVLTIDIIV